MRRRRQIALVLAVGTLLGACASGADALQRRPGRVLLRGGTFGGTEVLIRAVDDGEILWVHGYDLGNEAWLDPGSHRISIMCRMTTAFSQGLHPGQVALVAAPGTSYTLVPTGTGSGCDVQARPDS